MAMSSAAELAPADLNRVCDTSRFAFKTTAELPFTEQIIGQPRGTRAIEFGIGIKSPGFNIYVLGPTGTGRTTTIERFLRDKAAAEPVPGDWVYVQNFQDPRRPRAITLPAGMGAQFRDDMAELISALQREIPKAFQTEEYGDGRGQVTERLETDRNRALQALHQQAAQSNFAIVRTPDGLIVAPLVDGEPMRMEAYQALGDEERQHLDAARRGLERNLEETLKAVAELEHRARREMVALDQRIAASVVDQYLEGMRGKYGAEEEALLHLDLVRQDVIDNVADFRSDLKQAADDKPGDDPLRRYDVNLIVDHRASTGAPVLVESNPTHHTLVGRIEYEMRFGMPLTSFGNIKAGSLHRANGGYLVIRAGDILASPHAWRALKRALNDRLVRMEEPATESLATKTLDPEPIPLDIKIILMGSPALYYSLYALEEDFGKLFKVRADFDVQMDRTAENEDEFASFIAARCHEEGLCHFDREAVGKMIEYGSRLAGSQSRLVTRFGVVADVVREAAFRAQQAGRSTVEPADVRAAIDERTYRANLFQEHLRRQVTEKRLFIDTTGTAIGQVNGLYVIELGDYAFAQPCRITAQTHMGRAGLISIEREVRLAGPLHNRGVLTLAGYLGGTYAQRHPLSLSASVTMEQNYRGIDGDSASSAELYALLSSLARLPIKQAIAVTGSLNQWGAVQPIGGVTEKIEGYYDLCAADGLTGEQGVLIPAANRDDLTLRDDVVEAVSGGRFHVWAVTTIDEGLEILTGVPAGTRQADDSYPAGTVHHRVQERLHQLAHELEAFTSHRADC
jgi:lon-related putative ATP-dependent protease